MPNTIYNKNNSLSRFNPIKNWAKVLFRPDKKLQTTEIEEVQDLVNSQITKAFNTLYSFYTVVKGCKILLTNITNLNYEFILTDGQIYIVLDDQGYFIDVPSFNFSTDRLSSTYVGVKVERILSRDEEDYNNPQVGISFTNTYGAERLLIKASIEVYSTVNINNSLNNSYPIAIIKPKTTTFLNANNDKGDGAPEILYYKNEELTYLNQEINLSTYIKKLIELRLYETTGNFISYGMNININTTTNKLCITPGVAYINGKRIQTNYNNYFKIDPYNINSNNLILNKQYLFYITDKAKFEYVSSDNINSFLEVPNNSIGLAYVTLNNRNNLVLDYSIIETPTRMPSISNIINLIKSNDDNIKELADITLKADLLNLSSNSINNKLNGIFTDSFTDLNNSDIYFPNYKTSILPSTQAISLPFTSTNKNNRNITIDQSNSNILIESIINENNELVPYWSTIQGASYKLFNTPPNITSTITIPTKSDSQIIITVSPSIIYKSDENTFVNFSNPNLKKLFKFKETINVDTPFNNNIYNRTVSIFATGFSSLQNNITVQINNISITSFNVLNGTLGSSAGTLKADQNGTLQFTFSIPAISQANNYIIALNSGTTSGTAEIQIIDPELSRIEKEKRDKFVQFKTCKYPLINSGLAQTFTITNSVMVKGVECTITDFPAISNTNILSVQIVSVNSNNIPIEVLGYGELSFAQVSPLINRSIPQSSTINLKKPINLNIGKYAIVFNTAIVGIKLGATKAGEPRLLDGKNFYYDPLKTEVLYYDTNWIKNTTVDNLACDLILHKPVSLLSSTILDITSNQNSLFNIVDIDLSIEGNENSYIDLFILNNQNQYEEIFNGSFFFKEPIQSTKLKINIKGTVNTHPIINLDNINIALISNEKEGVWVSKNQEYESPYNNLSMSIDIYKPNNTTFKFYFSSNKGVTWEELQNPLIENVDSSLNINKYTFNKNNLGFVILNSASQERYNLRYKIEFSVLNIEGVLPFFKNLVSITNP